MQRKIIQDKLANVRLIKLEDIIQKLSATERYIGNNFLVGRAKELQVPMPGENPFTLANMGISRHLHSSDPLVSLGLLTAIGGRKMLMYGEPGSGKSTLYRILNRVFRSPDEWQGYTIGSAEAGEDIFATPNLDMISRGQGFGINWKPITDSHLLGLDEFSRYSGYAQSLWLSAMSENRVQYQGQTKALPNDVSFFLMANALNHGETFGIIPAIRSRVDIALLVQHRENQFSNLFTKSKPLADYAQDFTFSEEEKNILREYIEEIKIPLEVGFNLNAFIDQINTLPAKMLAGENNTQSALYGKYAQTLSDHVARQSSNEQGDHSEDIMFQHISGFSDRDRQKLEWYSKALAVSTGETTVRAEHVLAVFPYIAYQLIKPNELAGKANHDRIPYGQEEINWLKKLGTEIWRKVDERFDADQEGASAFVDPKGSISPVGTTIIDYQIRWGLTDVDLNSVSPAKNLKQLFMSANSMINTGKLHEAMILTLVTLKKWDEELDEKSDFNAIPEIISGLKMLDYLSDQFGG